MMSKELLKKAGILGVAFGLVASPLTFAQEPADPADNISPDEQPVEAQSNDSAMPSDHDKTDLTHDEGDNASDMEPNSMMMTRMLPMTAPKNSQKKIVVCNE